MEAIHGVTEDIGNPKNYQSQKMQLFGMFLLALSINNTTSLQSLTGTKF